MGLVQLVALSTVWVAGEDSQHFLGMANDFRRRHGLAELKLAQSMSQMAASHARFMSSNNFLTHIQDPTMPNFVGRTLADRAEKFQCEGPLGELVGYSSRSVDDAFYSICDSPVHRAKLLRPGSLSFGAGSEAEFVCVIVGGTPLDQPVVSPPKDSTNVKTQWSSAKDFAGTQSGPDSLLCGYPAVCVLPAITGVDGLNVKVTMASEGKPSLDVKVLGSHNSPYFSDAVAIVPLAPLSGETRYTVTLDVTWSGQGAYSTKWSFTTGKPATTTTTKKKRKLD